MEDFTPQRRQSTFTGRLSFRTPEKFGYALIEECAEEEDFQLPELRKMLFFQSVSSEKTSSNAIPRKLSSGLIKDEEDVEEAHPQIEVMPGTSYPHTWVDITPKTSYLRTHKSLTIDDSPLPKEVSSPLHPARRSRSLSLTDPPTSSTYSAPSTPTESVEVIVIDSPNTHDMGASTPSLDYRGSKPIYTDVSSTEVVVIDSYVDKEMRVVSLLPDTQPTASSPPKPTSPLFSDPLPNLLSSINNLSHTQQTPMYPLSPILPRDPPPNLFSSTDTLLRTSPARGFHPPPTNSSSPNSHTLSVSSSQSYPPSPLQLTHTHPVKCIGALFPVVDSARPPTPPHTLKPQKTSFAENLFLLLQKKATHLSKIAFLEAKKGGFFSQKKGSKKALTRQIAKIFNRSLLEANQAIRYLKSPQMGGEKQTGETVLPEKISFFMLRYYGQLRSVLNYGPRKAYAVMLKFLGNQFFPANTMGLSEYQILPGFRCVDMIELRLVGLHCRPWHCISTRWHLKKYSVAASLVLDDGIIVLSDYGSRFVLVTRICIEDNQDVPALQHYDIVSLLNSMMLDLPIRVIRGYRCFSRYRPKWGFRYDGLYQIVDFFSDTLNGWKVWKFFFVSMSKEYCSEVCVSTEDSSPEIDEEFILSSNRYTSSSIESHILWARLNVGIPELLSSDAQLHAFDVFEDEICLFRLSFKEFISIDDDSRNRIPANFITILEELKSAYADYCKRKAVRPAWLEGAVRQYELPSGSLDKPMWAVGGFLPLTLRVNYVDFSQSEDLSPTLYPVSKEKILSLNERMSMLTASQFFPETKSEGIRSSISLEAPMEATWNPWKDLSHGEERFPLPVVNTVDEDTPPMDFSYKRKSVFFNRLPKMRLIPCCLGCVPTASNETSQPPSSSVFEKISLPGKCAARKDSSSQRIYCEGIHREMFVDSGCHYACSKNCLCSKHYCTNRFKSGLQFPCRVVKSVRFGWELQTQVAIPEDAYVLQYSGEMLCRFEMEGRASRCDKLKTSNFCMECVSDEGLREDWKMPCFDASMIGNAARFLNHSCRPNLRALTVWRGPDHPVICFMAIRPIKANEALTYFYGAAYERLVCLCGEDNCSGLIGCSV